MDNFKEVFAAKIKADWKRQRRRILISRISRWGVGVPLMLSWPFILPFGPLLALFGAILIVPDIAGFFARAAGNLIWTNRKGTLSPIYGIPDSLMARGRYVEAEEEYEKIIQQFPDEVKPHIEMINIAVMRLNDGVLAGQLFQRGMGLLHNAADRETLSAAYERVRTRLKPDKLDETRSISSEKLGLAREQVKETLRNLRPH